MTGSFILIALAVCLVLALAVFLPVVLRARKIDLAGAPQTAPPKETMQALEQDNEKDALFDLGEGEKIAAPFAEQIEDILAARVKADPRLASVKIDFGTASDGSLQIWADGVCYTDVKEIPDEKLRRALADAIRAWEEHYTKS